MISEVCGWWVIPFAFFFFLVFLIREQDWSQATSDYVILSIPVIQILAFLANPPRVSAVPVLFIAWLVILVFPTSRDYWIYTRWKRIPMYENVNERSLWRKGVPIPLLIIIGGILALEGAWFLSGRWSLVLLWLWGVAHLIAIMNRKLKWFTIFTIRYLPLISVVVYMIQCGNCPSIIYGASILVSWIWLLLSNSNNNEMKGEYNIWIQP